MEKTFYKNQHLLMIKNLSKLGVLETVNLIKQCSQKIYS